MYIVQNMTRHEIALGDLRAIIRPGKQEDLDRFADRYVVEQSKDLRIALKRGALRLVRKDNPFGGVATDPQPATPAPKAEPQPDVMGALKEMEKRLTQRLDNQVEKHVGSGGLDEDSVSKLNDAIAALQGIAGGGGLVAQPQQSDNSSQQEYEVEDEKVVDIHERSINRLTKDAESNIQHKKEVGSSDAEANISELEDLL